MNTEKIAFLFPFHRSKSDDKSPMLLMETDELPVVTDIHFQVHFLGLVDGKEYWIAASVFKVEENLEVRLSGEKGVWIRAKGHPSSQNTLATSLTMHFDKCRFDDEGEYLIRVSISKDKVLMHEAHAYFSVSKVQNA